METEESALTAQMEPLHCQAYCFKKSNITDHSRRRFNTYTPQRSSIDEAGFVYPRLLLICGRLRDDVGGGGRGDGEGGGDSASLALDKLLSLLELPSLALLGFLSSLHPFVFCILNESNQRYGLTCAFDKPKPAAISSRSAGERCEGKREF
uniref:Uncharacterized protein n=1 Tax=Glossina pallidipes TaxID=7398 RepID=A0A1A9ZT75_GLOPL